VYEVSVVEVQKAFFPLVARWPQLGIQQIAIELCEFTIRPKFGSANSIKDI
jgi:hypothetical protein